MSEDCRARFDLTQWNIYVSEAEALNFVKENRAYLIKHEAKCLNLNTSSKAFGPFLNSGNSIYSAFFWLRHFKLKPYVPLSLSFRIQSFLLYLCYINSLVVGDVVPGVLGAIPEGGTSLDNVVDGTTDLGGLVGAVHNGLSAATADDVFSEVRRLGDSHHAAVDLDPVGDGWCTGAALRKLLHLRGHHSAFHRSDGVALRRAQTTLRRHLESVLLEVSNTWSMGNIEVTDGANMSSDGSCLSLSRGDLLGLGTFLCLLDWDGSGHSSRGEDSSADGNGFSSETHFEDVGFEKKRMQEKRRWIKRGEDGSGSDVMW